MFASEKQQYNHIVSRSLSFTEFAVNIPTSCITRQEIEQIQINF